MSIEPGQPHWTAVERAQVEAALRASEEERRSLITEMNEGFCILEVILDEAGCGLDYRFIETNPAFIRQGGFDPAGRLMSEIAPIEPVWPAAYGRVAATGVPDWVRRCVEAIRDGRFTLEQQTNAYAVLPDSQWLGAGVFCPVLPPTPPPDTGTWGDHPPLPDAITAALQDSQAGGGHAALVVGLEADPGDGLALPRSARKARQWPATSRRCVILPGGHTGRETQPHIFTLCRSTQNNPR